MGKVCLYSILILVLGSVFSSCSDRYGPVPSVSDYNDTPSYYLESPSEKEISRQLINLCRDLGLKETIEPDRALAAAARNIVIEIKNTDLDLIMKMDNDRIKQFMTEEGLTDNAFRSLLMNVVRMDDVKTNLMENLGKDLQTGRYSHFGVGAVRLMWPPTVVAALILTRKTAMLSPIPRVVLPGDEITLSGRILLAGDSLNVIIHGPGKEQSFFPRVASGGAFFQSFVLKEPGTHMVELMMSTRFGPEVAALFPVKAEGVKGEGAVPALEHVPVANVEEARRRLLDLINKERAKRDLLPVTQDEKINRIAQNYAEEMMSTGMVAHVSEKTGDCAERADAAGIEYRKISENIAVNQSLEKVHESLMSSPSHERNILDPDMEWAGLGIAFTKDKNQVFVVENFVKMKSR